MSVACAREAHAAQVPGSRLGHGFELKGTRVKETQEQQIGIGDVYAAVAARRNLSDQLLWQVPPLAIASQAFLLTIALGGDAAQASRITAALLAVLLCLVSLQLMAKFRVVERVTRGGSRLETSRSAFAKSTVRVGFIGEPSRRSLWAGSTHGPSLAPASSGCGPSLPLASLISLPSS